MTDPAPAPAPVQANERIAALDIVRGFALLGVLVANINSSLPAPFQGIPGLFNDDAAWLDKAVHSFMSMFVDGRFYTMFSLLFGAGFVIFIDRARARGVRAETLFMRRLMALSLIGLAHGVLIWYGDVLLIYACLGFLLLTFIDVPWQRLWKWGLLFYSVPTLLVFIRTLLAGDVAPVNATVTRAAQELAGEAAMAVYTGASWQEAAQLRLADIGRVWEYLVPRWFGPSAFGMFLIGAAIVRSGLFNAPHEHRVLLRRLAWTGIPGGALLVVLYLWQITPDYRPLNVALDHLAGLLQCLAYVAALLLLLQTDRVAQWLRRLAPVGRMALTNYLAQSLVFTWFFCGYGLDVGDSLGRAASTALALVFFAGQMAFSRWWLERYRFGPMEWVWRTMTYGHAPSMQIDLVTQKNAQSHIPSSTPAPQPAVTHPHDTMRRHAQGRDWPDTP